MSQAMDSVKLARTVNYSAIEKNLLLELVAKYKYIIESKATNASSLREKQTTWQQLTAECNASSGTARNEKQIKTLYFNLKRKLRKDVAEEHKKEYIAAKTVAAIDKRELNKTGGGSYHSQLDEAGAQLLAIVGDQVEPLPNPFDDAAAFFGEDIEDIMFDIASPSAEPGSLEHESPVPAPPVPALPGSPVPIPPKKRKIIKKSKRKPNYKTMYFKKKYEVACFELKSRKIIHNLDVKIRKKQLQ